MFVVGTLIITVIMKNNSLHKSNYVEGLCGRSQMSSYYNIDPTHSCFSIPQQTTIISVVIQKDIENQTSYRRKIHAISDNLKTWWVILLQLISHFVSR